MKNTYTPPFDITDEMLNLVSSIMKKLGSLSNINNLNRIPKLREVNRIRSIQSSLAIENNSLSFEQVRDIINNKKVVGSEEDIIAFKNAIEAYKEIENINPYNLNDLLKIHGIMMKDLKDEPGK